MQKDEFSSNINEVIKAVLNFLLFFYEKISHAQKSTKKHKKHQKAPNAQKSTKMQPSKSTKTQISEQKFKKMCLKTSKRKKVIYSLICIFVFFVQAKKRK